MCTSFQGVFELQFQPQPMKVPYSFHSTNLKGGVNQLQEPYFPIPYLDQSRERIFHIFIRRKKGSKNFKSLGHPLYIQLTFQSIKVNR